jgi:hypothetical protein
MKHKQYRCTDTKKVRKNRDDGKHDNNFPRRIEKTSKNIPLVKSTRQRRDGWAHSQKYEATSGNLRKWRKEQPSFWFPGLYPLGRDKDLHRSSAIG